MAARGTFDESFIGRRVEVDMLADHIADALGARPSTVLVGGEAGIGKTTLVSECSARAEVPLYLARSMHLGGDAIPFAPLVDLLRQVRRAHPQLLDDAGMAPLRHWHAPGSSASESVPQGELFGGVLDLLRSLGEGHAAVVAFEDLHWADAVTWDLFSHLARHLLDERVLLVGTFRSNEVASDARQRRAVAELGRLSRVRRIELSGLSAPEVESLLGEAVPRDLVRTVVARGQGNPFFTRALLEAHLAGEDIPVVLSDLLSAELAGIDGDERVVLEAMACLGRPVPHALLASVAAISDSAIEPAVRHLVDARLVSLDKQTDAYRLRHPLLGEVMYADLLPPQRKRLHARIADALRDHRDVGLLGANGAGELAFHLDQAGASADALGAHLAAADAAELVAPGAALRHLERAFELWDAPGGESAPAGRVDRLWQAAELATSTVGNPRAVDLARAAFALGAPSRGAAWGHERLGRYLWSSGRLEECAVEFALAAEALRGGTTEGDDAVRAGLGQAALMAGEYAEAELWCRDLLERDASRADDGATVMARRVLGIARCTQGDPEAGVALCREAVAAARGAQARTLANLYLTVALSDAGDHAAAMRTAFDAVAEGHETGLDPGFGCYFDSLAAESLLRLGRWSEADAAIERHPVPNTLPVGRLRCARVAAMLAARRGEGVRALEVLEVAEALALDGWHRSVLDATGADVHVVLGDWPRALAAAERGWQVAAGSSPLWAARFAMWGAMAAVELVLDARAQRDAVDAEEVRSRFAARIDAVHDSLAAAARTPRRDSHAHLAHAAASLTRLGAPDPDAWSRAVDAWRHNGDEWFTAVALLRLAEAALACGQVHRASSSLRESHELAVRLGAGTLLREIEAVSRRTRVSLEAPVRLSAEPGAFERLGLTAREAEVLGLVAVGRTNRQIGEALYVSEKTASVHVSNILRKLGVTTRVDAAAVAQRLGIA